MLKILLHSDEEDSGQQSRVEKLREEVPWDIALLLDLGQEVHDIEDIMILILVTPALVVKLHHIGEKPKEDISVTGQGTPGHQRKKKSRIIGEKSHKSIWKMVKKGRKRAGDNILCNVKNLASVVLILHSSCFDESMLKNLMK